MAGHRLEISKELPGTPEEVFDAWTDAANLAEWICPGGGTATVPKLEARVDGAYQIDMHVGDTTIEHWGKYLEVDRPHRLAFTWISKPTNEQETVVTIALKAQGDGTLLTLVHEGLPAAESAQAHEGGWTAIVDQLAARLGVTA